MPRTRILLTCHGVNADGAWQEMVARILRPFFQCRPVRYDQFRRFGLTLQVVGLWPLLVASVIPIAKARLGLAAYVAWGILVVCIAVAFREPFRRRDRALATVRAEYTRWVPTGIPRPHVVAHSFGTYLIGKAMDRFPNVRFNRVLLVGSVLSTHFDLQALYKRGAFIELRNEVGRRDRIAKLSPFLRRVDKDFGPSGCDGFAGDQGFVHCCDGHSRCSVCAADDGEKGGQVHNVELKFAHSETLEEGHVYASWLPFLMGYEISEYRRFLELCTDAALLQSEDDREALAALEIDLGDAVFQWTGGTFLEFLERQVRAHLRWYKLALPSTEFRVNDVALYARGLVWTDVADAVAATREKDPSEIRLRALWPNAAVLRAVAVAVRRFT